MTANQLLAQSEFLEPVPTTLARASREMLKFVQIIEELEVVVGQAVASMNSAEEVRIQELQKLDHVSQMIVGAAEFLQALTQDMPSDWRVDVRRAARSVRLAELACRLGDFTPEHAAESAQESGDCDLF